MALAAGTRVGMYEVLGLVGSGGMGEVYRARDSKLGRDVALKVLPPSVAQDPDRVARFEREARTLAGLNHPNIAHVYGFEQSPGLSALIMELVAGEDLSTRLTRGPLPIPEGLALARQMVDALEYAHANGVIHRDLKPGNVKVRPDGTVKILDFGLAKALDPFSSAAPGQIDAATMTSPAMTLQGVILGTAAYMSPEQARGHVVDQRADIWAFGVVLYEMLTGKLAFAAPTVTDTLARVIEREPDWTALPAATPAPVRTLLRRCLEKDPRKRAPHIGLARLDVDDALSGSAAPAALPSAVTAAPARSGRRSALLAAAGALVVLLAAVAGYALRPVTPAAPAVTYRSLLLMDEYMGNRPPSNRFSISPDGRWLAYVGSDEQSREVRLWLRSLADNVSQQIAGTEGAVGPFWSPDSRAIGYYANSHLWRVEIGGGPPVKVCDIVGAQPSTVPGTWGVNDVIVFNNGPTLWRVPSRGGKPEPVTKIEGPAETQHGFPWYLPGENRLLFTAYKGSDPVGVFGVDLQSGARTRVMETGSNVQFANGQLIFLRGTALVAQPFDPGTLTLSRDPVTLADPIMGNLTIARAGAFSVSQTGTVVYIPLARDAGSRLVWMTRDGQQTVVEESPSANRNLSLSPDGLRAAVVPMGFDGMTDLWLVDLKRGVRSRLTHDVVPTMALWSRDGRTLYYSARRGNGVLDLYSRGDAGAGPEQVVFRSDVDKWLTSVSADARTFIYETQGPGLSWDIYALTLDPTPRVSAVFASSFSERWGTLSPDGQWIAYAGNSSGQGDEIYVARYPTGAHRTQVSAKGGTFPRWHKLGRELFFYSGNQIFAAAVAPRADGMEVTSVTPLFTAVGPEGFARSFFDIASNDRFLVSVPGTQTMSYRLALLTNWPAVAGK